MRTALSAHQISSALMSKMSCNIEGGLMPRSPTAAATPFSLAAETVKPSSVKLTAFRRHRASASVGSSVPTICACSYTNGSFGTMQTQGIAMTRSPAASRGTLGKSHWPDC